MRTAKQVHSGNLFWGRGGAESGSEGTAELRERDLAEEGLVRAVVVGHVFAGRGLPAVCFSVLLPLLHVCVRVPVGEPGEVRVGVYNCVRACTACECTPRPLVRLCACLCLWRCRAPVSESEQRLVLVRIAEAGPPGTRIVIRPVQ